MEIDTPCYLINIIPNIILYKIIEYIKDNVDLICLLLTCKRLYFDILRQQPQRHLAFKGIGFYKWRIDGIHEVLNFNLLSSLTRFHLGAFKSLFDNALANQLVLLHNETNLDSDRRLNDDYSALIQHTTNQIDNNNNNNNNSYPITNVTIRPFQIDDEDTPQHQLLQLQEGIFTDIPSTTKTLVLRGLETNHLDKVLATVVSNNNNNNINNSQLESLEIVSTEFNESTAILVERLIGLKNIFLHYCPHIYIPSTTESLVISSNMDRHQPLNLKTLFRNLSSSSSSPSSSNLTTLDISSIDILDDINQPNLLPPTLKTLHIKLSQPPPISLFPQSLRNLFIKYSPLVKNVEEEEEEETPFAIILDHLKGLKKLSLDFSSRGCNHISLPLNLSVLKFQMWTTNLNNILPSGLTKLETDLDSLLLFGDHLPLHLKKLIIPSAERPIPVGLLPSGLLYLEIFFTGIDDNILAGSLPQGLEYLHLLSYIGPINSDIIPKSLKTLKLEFCQPDFDDDDLSTFLPHLERLEIVGSTKPLPTIYPSSLKYFDAQFEERYYIPTSVEHLICVANSTKLKDDIHSSSYSLDPFKNIDFINNNNNNDSDTRSKLKILEYRVDIPNGNHFSLKLNELVLRKDVEELFIFNYSDSSTYDYQIKRIDHNYVLMVNKNTLYGGLINITDRFYLDNDRTQERDLYLHFISQPDSFVIIQQISNNKDPTTNK
ncbi:hypothetical protein DFA_02255 [Cavenderia fasciculata]|uniref:F-box domain-containing protein n=1 Tax=Cavenderia fasciculata TaxID=261658 RepID=F4PYY3_CACFS|nr:uncharacterized protein DFA_02255 [Cavenderia fasciculata]EGG19012.1 hypothetical protein DFA_02255 [Cavenderia fasciculata]|eukprot:XP_004366645.1 hypothetical protein DFA_02255 [Cavenderia fasciculata]